jgi:acyl-coenzyme A thioesterase 9
VNISALKLETEEEHRLYNQGHENYNIKKQLAKTALRKQTPNDEESDLIHALWLQQMDNTGIYIPPSPSPTPSQLTPTPPETSPTKQKPANAFYMTESRIQSVQIMQPQYRNRHNFMIFGGFLLKSTFELAFTCASALSHTRPAFIALDPSTFENPVPVGSVLYMTAVAAYTDSPVVASGDVKMSPEGSTRVQIRVDSHIRSVEHGEVRATGQFNYTFEVKRDLKVVPQTYSQFMVYLDARRRAQRAVRGQARTVESGSAGKGVLS